MSDLFAPVCSIAPTRRRRFLWAAWWTAPPSREPFRKPDASNGGSPTREEALEEAVRVAGRELLVIEPRWARAWSRILLGLPPWFATRASSNERVAAPRLNEPPRGSAWAVLRVQPGASLAEVKSAFRKRALETHPDTGGDAEQFRAVQRAYEHALARATRAAKRRSR